MEAKVLGHGGVKRVHEATGVARGSILAGLRELEQGIVTITGEVRRIRRAGAWAQEVDRTGRRGERGAGTAR